MPEDVAIASRKSEVDTCTDNRDIDRPKSADRQTDGFSAYIVDIMLNKNTLGVKKVRSQSEAALQIGMCDQKR